MASPSGDPFYSPGATEECDTVLRELENFLPGFLRRCSESPGFESIPCVQSTQCDSAISIPDTNTLDYLQLSAVGPSHRIAESETVDICLSGNEQFEVSPPPQAIIPGDVDDVGATFQLGKHASGKQATIQENFGTQSVQQVLSADPTSFCPVVPGTSREQGAYSTSLDGFPHDSHLLKSSDSIDVGFVNNVPVQNRSVLACDQNVANSSGLETCHEMGHKKKPNDITVALEAGQHFSSVRVPARELCVTIGHPVERTYPPPHFAHDGLKAGAPPTCLTASTNIPEVSSAWDFSNALPHRTHASGIGSGQKSTAHIQIGRVAHPRRARKPRNKARKWTQAEQARFEEALEFWGRDWEKCAKHVGTRDISLIRSHAQKHFIKLYKTGKPLPRRVIESGAGYTLSGNPLRADGPSARSYLTSLEPPKSSPPLCLPQGQDNSEMLRAEPSAPYYGRIPCIASGKLGNQHTSLRTDGTHAPLRAPEWRPDAEFTHLLPTSTPGYPGHSVVLTPENDLSVMQAAGFTHEHRLQIGTTIEDSTGKPTTSNHHTLEIPQYDRKVLESIAAQGRQFPSSVCHDNTNQARQKTNGDPEKNDGGKSAMNFSGMLEGHTSQYNVFLPHNP